MTFKVLCTDGYGKAGIEELKKTSGIEVTFEKALTPEELLAKIPAFDALIVRSASKVTKAVLEAGTNLKIVVRAGVGTDNIDKVTAKERNIVVANAPAGNTTSTAELAFGMMMSLARHIPQASASMHEGKWEKKAYMGTELAGRTVGVIGLGRVGGAFAKRALAFEMKVLGYDPVLAKDAVQKLGVAPASLEEIFKNSDFITVHTPLTDETRNMIDAKAFAMMKPTVRLINCARGGIINEGALAAALKENRIAGAALDAFTKEPFEDPMFRGLANAVLTPHLGASTKEAQDKVAVEAAQKVVEFYAKSK